MWWHAQNLDKPVTGPDGTRWFFQVWHGTVDDAYCQRLFFWDESKSQTGLIELRGNETLHLSRIKQRFVKITSETEYRQRFVRPLEFPLERYW